MADPSPQRNRVGRLEPHHGSASGENRGGARRYLRSRRAARAGGAGVERAADPEPGNRKRDRLPFISRLRPLLASWFAPRRDYNQDECYFPYPKISFLVDEPDNLVCQMCLTSTFKLKSSDEQLGDSTFSILPCGHAFGSLCLRRWLERQNACPLCRLQLVYPGCGHNIPPRPVTRDAAHMLPRTLPDEGTIPQSCSRCLKTDLRQRAYFQFETAAHEFRVARERFARSGNPLDEESIFRRRAEFEVAVRDDFHVKYFKAWLSNW